MERILHALVIDDEQPVRDFVCTVLAADGWAVSRTASAEEAFRGLNVIETRHPDSALSEKYLKAYSHWKQILNNRL